MSGSSSSEASGGRGVFQKLGIILVLVAAVMLIHRFAARREGGFDPTAMLALGFVILASYTFGQLVERIKLPHITGYLIAGMGLGPSAVEFMPSAWREFQPLDQGILSESVIEQLGPLEVLAVSLIALTAGGELKIASLRKGLGAILGILGGQIVFIVLACMAFVVAISGRVPLLTLPGLGDLDLSAALALGAVVGTISIATSPAATIAVINDARAKGPFTDTLLATVVLKDVVVVMAFALVSTVAIQALGGGGEDAGDLGLYLLQHIGGALVVGVSVGFGIAQYLRYIQQEVLLFLAGVVYIGSYLATGFDLDPVVLFIAAGFATANFSSEGETLLNTVETLSLPVYVVFFTLAGAHLSLGDLMVVAPFAAALVLTRLLGIWLGVRVGGRLGGASLALQRHGYLGFVSQAGVAISLAGIVGARLGEAGQALNTLIVAGIAIHELIGPVLLKVGLGLAGEVGEADRVSAAPEEAEDEAEASDLEVKEWPVPQRAANAWGPPLKDVPDDVAGAVRELQLDLAGVVREVAGEPLRGFKDGAADFLRELRREFLRHHRRITVQALGDTELDAGEALRLEQAELAEKWRTAVVGRASRVSSQPDWEAAPILDAVDSVLDGVPEIVGIPYPDEAFRSKPGDGLRTRLSRFWLGVRRAFARVLGDGLSPRPVELRNLARYHLWGRLPERLEPVAALHTQAEGHLVARVRSIFEGLVKEYDELATRVEARRAALTTDLTVLPPALTPEELEGSLAVIRAQTEEELSLAFDEVGRIAEDLLERTSRGVGACLKDLKADLLVVGTPDLPANRRAVSRLYRKRSETLSWLDRGTKGVRKTSAARYSRLALEMELRRLEGRVKDVLEEHALKLGKDVRGRGYLQVRRVREAIQEAQEALAAALQEDLPGGAMAQRLRDILEPVLRTMAEAARLSNQMQTQLADEQSVAVLLDAVTRAAHGLTNRYRIPAAPIIRAEEKLPPPVGTVEVPFREWVLARIETGVAPRLVATTREWAAKVDPLAQALTELERRVAFNLELAVGELTVLPEESVQAETRTLVGDIVLGALDRNEELFQGYADESQAWGDEARSAFRDAVLSGLDEVRETLLDGSMGRFRSQIARDVTGWRIARGAGELRRALGRSMMLIGRAVREAVGEKRIDRVRHWLGLPANLGTPPIGEHTFDLPEPNATIPMVYRRLFSAQALEAGDILTGRDEALDRAQRIIQGKERGPLRTIALVGPDGVGKSAFVNATVRGHRYQKVREVRFEGPTTVAQVDKKLDQITDGQVVVVRGLHWLRALTPGSLAPLERFVDRVLADAGRAAFIVRADSLLWDQLRLAAPLDEAFPEIIRLDPLDPEGLRAAVLARHTVSGYGLVFTQGEAPKSRIEELALQLTTPISRPQESFFRALHTASGGLLRDALRLWLASVREVDETGDLVHLGPVPPPALFALRQLPDDCVLTLYQVARQGWMTPEVHASLFRTDEARAEAHLASLDHLGLLERHGDVRRIALHLRGAVHRLFRERGFVR